MSTEDYIPGSILQFLDKGSSSEKKSAINNLFQASKIVKPRIPTKNDQPTKATDKTIEEPNQIIKKPKKFNSNAEKRIFMKSWKENLQERKKQDSKTIFVGNLPIATDKKELLALFKKCGKIESIRFRSMPVKPGKAPKKVSVIKKDFNEKRTTFNAYVVFEKEECIEEALQLNNMEFKGFHLRVDNAEKTNKLSSKNSVFVGNMPYDVEEEGVRSFFDSCGTIESVRIVRDSKTSKGKGFAYVAFQDQDSADVALSLNGKKFMNRELRVEKCMSKKKSKPSSTVVVSNKSKPTSKVQISKQTPKSKGQRLKFKEMKEMKKREIIARKLQPNKPKDGKTLKKPTKTVRKPANSNTAKANQAKKTNDMSTTKTIKTSKVKKAAKK